MAIKSFLFVFLGLLLNCNVYQGREVNKAQQYNPNIDFLSHESGVLQPDLKAGLPNQPAAPGLQSTLQSNHRTTSSGKRDYVAPQRTTSKPHSTPSASSTAQQSKNPFDSNFPPLSPQKNSPSGKRDYVAPSWPNLPSPQSNLPPQTPTSIPQPTNKPAAPNTNSGRRDYVNPNWPALPTPSKNDPPSPTSPTLKPLSVDSAVTPPSLPQATNKPSAATTNGKRDYVNPNWPALPTPSVPSKNDPLSPSKPTVKPPSFSSVVAGGDKPMGNPSIPTSAPPKSPTVLPSSLVNKVQNSNNNSPTDLELQNFSEELLRKDTNNAFTLITINYQEKTTSQSKDDKAPHPFLVIPDRVWNMPTIQKFVPLLDNYEWDTLVNEYVTPQERKEENEFMDAIMSTSVIRHLISFLKDRGYVTLDPKQQRDFLKQLWFSLYSRGKGKIGSSAFEHIFVSELKNGQVSGLHNWIYFAKQEALNRVNYLGYMKLAELNNKGAVLKFHFSQQGYDKPVDSMFVGTSPELEMALYTVCFVTRADQDCRLKLGGKDVAIVTHTFRYRSKNLIGSAFPQI